METNTNQQSVYPYSPKENIKLDFLWTKSFLVMSLDDNNLLYIYDCNSTKEIWDNLNMIYGVSWSIEQEQMNTHSEEKCFGHKCFSKFSKVKNYIGILFTNQYIIVMNWNSSPILKSKD